MDIRSEAQEMHAKWIEAYRQLARNLLKDAYPKAHKCKAHILKFKDRAEDPNAFSFVSTAEFQLPQMSDEVFCEMARYCQFILSFPLYDEKKEIEYEIFPHRAFSLSHLLASSYPKKDGIFKDTTGAMLMVDFEQFFDEFPESVPHAIFCGLGVLLMDKCREIFDPLGTDEEIIKKTTEMILYFPHKDDKE